VIRPVAALVAAAALLAATGPTATGPMATGPADAAAPEPEASAVPLEADRRLGLPDDALAVDAAERLAAMSTEQKVRSLLLFHVPGTDPAAITAAVDAQGLAGVMLMGDNMPEGGAEGLAALTERIRPADGLPPIVAIDQEGGSVARLRPDPGRAPAELRGGAPEAVLASSTARAEALAAAGVDLNFGVVADATGDEASFIRSRVLGDSGAQAAPLVAAAVEGEHGTVLSTLKHFPGHGAVPGDSHVSVPSSSLDLDGWRADAALPFAAGVDAGAEAVMTGHLRFPAVDAAPASLSPVWHDVLREELGFTGLIITDDLLMLQASGEAEFADPAENAVRALAAGAGLLLYAMPADPAAAGVDVEALVDAATEEVGGRIDPAALDLAVLRVLLLRASLEG